MLWGDPSPRFAKQAVERPEQEGFCRLVEILTVNRLIIRELGCDVRNLGRTKPDIKPIKVFISNCRHIVVGGKTRECRRVRPDKLWIPDGENINLGSRSLSTDNESDITERDVHGTQRKFEETKISNSLKLVCVVVGNREPTTPKD